MNTWCDASSIDAFLPRVAEQIEVLAAGKPCHSSSRGQEVASTASAKSG
jgi:hypothetical protein